MTARHSLRYVATAGITAALITTTACSSGSSGKPAAPATSPSTTTTPASPAPYAKSGPYAVGYTTLHLADGRRVVVWYPAEADTAGHQQETIDLAGMLSPAL